MKFKVKNNLILGKDDVKKGSRLTVGAVYIQGDEIEVNRLEAVELLATAPEFFEPSDAEAKALAKES